MKKVLIIGAGFLQSFVIRKAKEMGYYTIAVDGNPNAEGFKYTDKYSVINIIDESACYQYAVEQKIDGVLTAATDYGVLTAAYIAEKMKLNGLYYDVAKIIKNKYQVRKKLSESNADDTKQAYEVENHSDVEKLIGLLDYPLMVKPCDGSGSRGASKVENEAELWNACEVAINNSVIRKALIESFIIGNEYGAESFVFDGVINILAVMKKWMTKPPYYAELGHAIPSGLPEDIEEKIKSSVKKSITALGINYGSVNMDLLLSENNDVHIIDIGARMGGNMIGSHIIPIGTGVDYMGIMIQGAVGDLKTCNIHTENTKGNVITRLLALTPGKIKEIPDIAYIEKRYNVKIFHHLHVGDCINEYHTNLDGMGYIISVSEKNAVEALRFIDENIIRE